MTEPEPTNDAPAPTPWTPPAEPPPEVKRGADPAYRVIAALALALIVVLALVGTSPFWAPGVGSVLPWGNPGSGRAGADIGALQARLDGDEATLKDQAARLARLQADPGAIKNLTARVAALEARPVPAPAPAKPASAAAPPPPPPADTAALTALKDQVAKLAADSAATGAKLAKLEARLGAVAAKDQAERARLLALADLRASLEGSGPYAAELAAVEALAADKAKVQAALGSLEAGAKTGLPSLADLTERFDREVAPAILRSSGDTASRDFGQQILARLKRLVVIRRIGGPLPHDPVEAAVVRADDDLKSGNLAAAVAALDHLPAAGAAAAASWLAAAKQRVAAEAALDREWQAETALAAAAPAPAGDKP